MAYHYDVLPVVSAFCFNMMYCAIRKVRTTPVEERRALRVSVVYTDWDDALLYTYGLHILQDLIGAVCRESSCICFAASCLTHQACSQDSLKTSRLWYVQVTSEYLSCVLFCLLCL